MVLPKRAFPHIGSRNRSVQSFGERRQYVPSPGTQHASASPDHRTGRCGKQRRGFSDRAGCCGRRCSGLHPQVADARLIHLAPQQIDGHLDIDRPAGWRHRLAPALGEHVWQVRRSLDPRGPFHDRFERRQLVMEVVQEAPALADHVARNLAGDRDNRDIRRRRFHQRRQGIERTRSSRQQQRRSLATNSGVSVGGKPGIQLGPKVQCPQAARPKALPHRQRVNAREPKNHLGAQRFQAFDDEVPTSPGSYLPRHWPTLFAWRNDQMS